MWTKKKIGALSLLVVIIIALTISAAGLARVWFASERRASQRSRALVSAVRYCDVADVAALLGAGANPNTPIQDEPLPGLRELVMRRLSHHRATRGPNVLLASAEPHLDSFSGDKYPHGTEAKRAAIIEVLLAHGADVNYRDESGNTAAFYAACWDDTVGLAVLAAHGADLDATNQRGENPLFWAAESGNLGAVKLLLGRGVRANVQPKGEYSVLILACQAGEASEPMVAALLEHGADCNAKTDSGDTALDFAVGDVSRLLRAHGAR